MRLIDADALIKVLANRTPWAIVSPEDKAFVEGLSEAYEAIKSAPTIDAVPVVRCRDCKHYKLSRYNGNTAYYCGVIDGFPKEDWFCKDGHSREDGDA